MSNLFFEHMFFVAVGSCIVTNHAAGSGTAFVAIKEFRIFVDDGGVVADGSMERMKLKSSMARLSSPTLARRSPRL